MNEKPIVFRCTLALDGHFILKNNKTIRFNRKTGNRFISSNDRVISAKNILSNLLRQFRITIKEPIDYEINAKFVFYFPDKIYYTKKGAKNKKLPDISNLYQLPEDCLQAAGIILDDRFIESHDGSRRLPVSKASEELQKHGQNHYLLIELSRT